MASERFGTNVYARALAGAAKEMAVEVTTFLTTMRRFQLLRREDKTGVSGVGVVAEGVEFADGRASLCWLKSALDPSRGGAIATFASVEEVRETHGHGGATVIVWIDEAPAAVPTAA
jgi:hypothetical protein